MNFKRNRNAEEENTFRRLLSSSNASFTNHIKKFPTVLNDIKYKSRRVVGFMYRLSWRYIQSYNPKTLVRHTAYATLAALFTFIGIGIFSNNLGGLSAASTNLVPDGDITTNWPTTTGASHYTEIDEGSTPDTADYIATDTNNSDYVDEFSMTTASSILEATELTVYIRANAVAIQSDPDTLDIDMRINGTLQGAQTVTPSNGSYSWLSATFTGSWMQSDIDSMQVELTRNVVGGGNPNNRADEIRVATVYADMTYEVDVAAEQSSYRWFENSTGTATTQDWWDSNWSARRKITLNNSSSSENLVNFPVLVKLNSNRIDYGMAANEGQDIRFVDEDNQTQLDYEIETWNSGGESQVWVNVPQLDANDSAESIWMYYGNSSATDAQSPNFVWDSNYEGVWHLNNDPVGEPEITNPTYTENFDSGGTWTNGGTTSGTYTWSARSEVTADTPSNYWAYNDGTNDGYDTGGAIDYYSYSPIIDVSSLSNPYVGLKYMLDLQEVGTQYDGAFVEIVDAADPTTVLDSQELMTNQSSWTSHFQSIDPGWGNVRARVRINTTDGTSNAGFGFRVDSVNVFDNQEGPPIVDSTSNDYHGTPNGDMTTDDQVTGQINGAIDFDGVDDYIDAGNINSGAGYSDLTVSFWVNTTDSDNKYLISKDASGSNTGDMSIRIGSSFSSDGVECNMLEQGGGSDYNLLSTSAINDGSWHNCTVTLDSTNGLNMYVDGVAENSDGAYAPTVWSNNTTLQFGSVLGEDTTYSSAAILDEIRISNVARSADWTEAEYLAVTDQMATYESSETYLIPDVGTPLAAQDTVATTPAEGTPFRLRATAHVSNAEAPSESLNLKLQYARQGVDGVCDASFSGESYKDVGTDSSAEFSYYNNTELSDGSGFEGATGDPVHSTDTNVQQTYVESNTFTNSSSIPIGQDGLWDFSLVDNGAEGETNYCFRIVYSDGATLTNYSSIAEAQTPPPTFTQSDYRWFENQDVVEGTTWAQTIGGSSDDYANTIIQTDDGGYAIAGSIASYGAGSTDQHLTKYNSSGVIEWSKTWGGTEFEYAYGLLQTDDGFIVSGITGGYGAGGYDQLLVKFDVNGVTQWSKTWGGSGDDYAYSDVVEADDGGYVVAGHSNSFGAGGYDQTLVKYDASGVVQWSKTWGGSGDDRALNVVKTDDGGYVTSGYTDSFGAGAIDQTLVKYDAIGQEQWSKTWGGSGNDHVRGGLVKTTDGGFAVSGYTDSFGAGAIDQTLVKYDANGQEQWSKTWGGPQDDYTYDLVQTSDDGFAVAGRTLSYGAGDSDQTLVKYDSDGQEQWSKTWGGAAYEYASSLTQTKDGKYVVAGWTESYGVANYDQTFLKYDSFGNIDNCDNYCDDVDATEADQTITEADQTITEADQTVSEANVAVSETDQTGNLTVEVLCGPTTFASAYGGTSADEIYSLEQTSDGGFIAAGLSESQFSTSSQNIMKYDSSGVEQWTKSWDGSGSDYIQALVKTEDGGYAAGGDTTSYGAGSTDQTLVKYNASGQEQWSKTWGGTQDDYLQGLIQTSDGGYATVGYGNSLGAGGYDQTLVKYNASGQEQWSKTWGDTGDDYALDIVQTADDGYVVAGYSNSYGAGGQDQTLVKYNANGQEQWSKTWGGGSGDYARELTKTADGGFAVVGYTASYGAGGNDHSLVKYDATGQVEWSKTWGGGSGDQALALAQTNDGGYVVVGDTASYGAGGYDVTFIKYSSSGQVEWSKIWGGANDDSPQDVIQTEDGGYAIGGYSMSYGAGGSDKLLLKYDQNGDIYNCGSECVDSSVTETDHAVSESDVTITEADQDIAEGDVAISETDQTGTETYTEIAEASLMTLYKLFVGDSLAAQSNTYNSETHNEALRLRMLVEVADKSVASGDMKLQYSSKYGECDTDFIGENYTDVPDTYMQFFDNATALDGATIEPSPNDPTNGGATNLQEYVEANSFSVTSFVSSGENALWDFALSETNGENGGDYCFRIVHTDNSLLDAYEHIPELGIPPKAAQQLRHGQFFDTAQQAQPFYW